MAVEIGALRALLSLDSTAFERGAQRAQASMGAMQQRLARMGDSLTSFGRTMSLRVTTPIVAGGSLMAISAMNSAVEIQRLAQVADASTEEFQRFAAGAETVGIENDKLADILKDVNDRIGDFMATGGGPMADFFENIAPLVGVTADDFARLSGPEALQLYVDSLEAANVSQKEMTSYLEAMASDATALIPLLSNGAAEMERLGQRASDLGAIMSEETIIALNETRQAMRDLTGAGEGFRNQIMAAMAPMLSSLAEAVAGLADRFAALSPEVKNFTAIAVGLAAVIGPLAVAVGLFATALAAVSAPVVAAVAAAGALVTALAVYWDDMQARARELQAGYAEAWQVVRDNVTGWAAEAVQWGGDMAAGIVDGIRERMSDIVAGYQEMWASIAAEVSTWPARMVDLGGNIVQGLIDGITERGERAVEAITGIGSRLIDGIRNRLGVQSPSRVMMEIGRFISEGLALGIESNAARPVTAMQEMSSAVAEAGQVAERSMQGFGSRFASFVAPILTGAQSVGDAIASMAGRIGNSLLMSGLEGLGNMLFGGIFGGFRAAGGPVSAGRAYVVGERGPEVIVPSAAGTVIPNHALGGGGGGAMAITVNVSGANGDRHVIDLVQQGVAAGLRQYDRGLPDRVQAIQRDPLARA